MVDIRIDGYSVDMTPGTRLTLERFNPMLDFSAVQGSRVYGFTLPDTPLNRRILGFVNQAQVPYRNRKFYCEKYVNTQLIERGYVKIQDAPSGSYNLYFTQNLGEIFGDLQNVLLPDIDFGSVAAPAAPVLDVDHLTAPFAFPQVENPGFYGNNGSVPGFNNAMNRVDVVSGVMDEKARVPMVFLPWLFQQFGEMTGWQFDGGFLEDPDILRLLFFNLYSLDELSTIQYQNHLPELSFPQLLIALRQKFNLYMDFDVRRRLCTLDYSDDILKAPTMLDWSAKAEPTHTKLPELQNRLELSYAIDGNDALMKPIPADFDKYTTAETAQTAGGSLLPIQSRFSTLQTNPTSGLAMTSQPGISVYNKDSAARGMPRLLFWKGITDGRPVATNEINGRRLVWNGAGNLVDYHWRAFERFKANTFLIRKILYLTPADLATFRFRNKVHIRGVNYIIGSMKAVLGADENIIPAEVDLWKV
ncbi:hypothetical protein LX87_04079 [Larkinella arboricola]|uniref:Uncharacterized protein n=1 Tax=Larkinella arboricola TaxID=643671 RepID=A0A327WPQ2_LARAB|nr:hypothetical protein [Larkinella arboricola]RAJ94194.1 hypothetical protein LX87_04079 [Larkinella arboricola]